MKRQIRHSAHWAPAGQGEQRIMLVRRHSHQGQDQLRSAMASPAMMARATGEGSDPSSVNPSRT